MPCPCWPAMIRQVDTKEAQVPGYAIKLGEPRRWLSAAAKVAEAGCPYPWQRAGGSPFETGTLQPQCDMSM